MLVPVKIVKQWISELESGKYEKTVGNLCTSIIKDGKEIKQYCALGLLGMFGTGKFNTPDPVKRSDVEWLVLESKGKDYRVSNLPSNYFESLPNYSKMDVIEIDQEDIMNKNDNNNLSFKEIAQYLRTKLKA